MATIRLKKRAATGAAGAPSSLAPSEVAFNEADKTLYYGFGDNGSGESSSVISIGGEGAVMHLGNVNQTAAGNKTFTGNLTVGGNLTVNGSTSTLNTTNSTVKDKLIELGNGTSGSPSGDAGIVMERGSSSNAFMGWDESADKFLMGTGSFTGTSTGNLTVSKGTLQANLEGDVTGTLTGNATGSSGSCTGNSATASKLATARTISGVSFDGTSNITLNNANITNGAGYVTANTQLSNEQVQDIVGGMVSGNTESGITVTYQDGDGTLDFSVASQTDNNFTTALKNKLDGIAANATNVTNTNQLTNGAGFITSTLTNEQVQDIVGGMINGNTESGINVTYQDSDGTLDFAVASQTDNNFTNALKSKLDGIAAGATNTAAPYYTSAIAVGDGGLTQKNFTTALLNKLNGIATGATNVTNTNQLTNGAGFVTSSIINSLNASNLSSGTVPAARIGVVDGGTF